MADAASAPRPLPAYWTKRPEGVICPGCGANVTSKVEVNSCTVANWVLCLLTSACCVFLPSMCNCASDITHRCPNCDYALGAKSAC